MRISIWKQTGNYYYGARYYNPKWSVWLSVDPLAELMPTFSSYNYNFSNPVKYSDPSGMAPEIAEGPDDWVLGKDGKYTWDANVTSAKDSDLNGREYIGKSTDDVAEHYADNNPVSNFFGGSPKFGDTSTWPGEIKQRDMDWKDDWSESSNIFAKMTYGFANDTSIFLQSMNPFDSQLTHINGFGVTPSEKLDSGVLGMINVFAAPLSWAEGSANQVLVNFTKSNGGGFTLFQRFTGKNFRIDFDFKNFFHYHRRGLSPNGTTLPGQGIGRHRPWQTKSTDTNFFNRF